jgi:MFS superfamily sulfate permease-like transporter
VPTKIIKLAGTIVLSAVIGFQSLGIDTVGTIPTGLPLPDIPAVKLGEVQNLIVPAMAIMLVAYANTIATARAFAAKKNEEINIAQESFGLGIANVASGVFGGIPVSGSGTRTAVNHENHAKTQVAQLFAGALTALTLIFLAPTLKYLPQSALAVIIIIAVSLYLFTVYCHRNIHLTQLNNEALATNSSQKYLSYSLKHLPGDNYFYSH